MVLGALALAPAAFLAVELVGISQGAVQSSVLELHTKMAEKLAEYVDDYFKVNDDKLSFALASLQKKMEWSDKQELLRSLIETHADIVEISILNHEGREIIKVYNPDQTKDSSLHSHGSSDGYREAMRTKGRVRRIIRHAQAPAVEMYYPMGPLVWARILISLRKLGDRICAERVGGTGFAVLIDAKGDPLFYPRQYLSSEAASRLAQGGIVAAALQPQTAGSRDVPSFEGASWVGAHAPVASIQGAVLMLQQRHEAYVSAIQMRRASVWVLLAVSVCAVLAGTILARQLTLPLLGLTRGAEAVARGDFQSRVNVSTGDELQDLAETFNTMTSELQRYSELQVDRLVAEQRKTEAILFSINDGILMFDGDGRIQLANRKVREYLGLSPGLNIEGQTLPEVMPESSLRETILQARCDPRPEAFKEINLSTESKHRFLRITAHPVVTPGSGAALGVVTAVRDVTFERELDKMKEEFLHYITHDLRNPLGSAMGFLELLMKGSVGALSAEQHSMVASVKRSTSRLMGMINNILDIAKMESGRIHLQLRTVSLPELARRASEILGSLAQQKGIKVRLEAKEDISVDADGDLLERVVTNLLGNAIKYTPKDGAITISVEHAGPAARVCVADTGEGIPLEFQQRIFEKFEQVTGQKRGGTGLGLTIAKFFVESHGGRIWVESDPGQGSRFYFTIPKGLSLDRAGEVVQRAGG